MVEKEDVPETDEVVGEETKTAGADAAVAAPPAEPAADTKPEASSVAEMPKEGEDDKDAATKED